MIKLSQLKQHRFALVIALWIFYTIAYGITKNFTYLNPINGYLAFIGEAGLDFICAILAFKAITKTQRLETNIMLLFAISFVLGIISDGSYNIILNIIGIKNFSPLVETVFDLPFALFLFLQTMAWILIFKIIYRKNKNHLRGLIFLPFLISGVAILFTFFLFPTWKISLDSTAGIYNTVDTMLEVISFALVVICLFSAKDKKLNLLASGYLVIIASDFVIRFSEVEKLLYPGSPLETTWVLGLLLFAIGLFRLNQSKTISIEQSLGSWNSLKVQIGYWLFTSSLTSIFVLLLINCLFASLDIRNVHDIPATLIVFAVLSALVSHIISAYLIRPFRYLNDIVHVYSKHDFDLLEKIEFKNKIEEFKELESCLYDGLKAIKNQALLERNYLASIREYSSEVSDLVSAIRMLAEDIDELPTEKKDLLTNTANQIYKITDGLSKKMALTPNQINDVISESNTGYNIPIIMIDDDKNLAMAWEMEAANAGIDLTTYHSPEDFMNDIKNINKEAVLYIDVHLSDSMSGIELSEWAYKLGFKNLYLITGGDHAQLQDIKWVKGVYGKKPPFVTDGEE